MNDRSREMQRNSKKRTAILECLRQTDSHPNAEWIYSRLKPTFPDLSIAT
ncbi:MAG: transcriptional repressor, partial [Clostridiales bacterium]|nr:transcriptional repressor [Candidatus Coliplasma caballi]